MSSTHRIHNWELAGIVFITVTGSVLHFLFELSGFWRPIAWLGAVNESTWEHFKLAFWPGLVWAILELCLTKVAATGFWAGKGLGLLAMPLIIAGVFYGYTAVVGTHYLWVDIMTFILAVIIGQYISYRIRTSTSRPARADWFGVAGLAIMMLAFVLFTYRSPTIFLFEHVSTHEYGILNTYD